MPPHLITHFLGLKRRNILFILLLALFSFFSPLATNMYLPAIPHLTPDIFLLFHREYG